MDKKEIIEGHFAEIMKALGLDLTDDSLQNTPKRVAKMYCDEIFYGLDGANFPTMTTQSNKFGYNQMLIETNITVNSTCEHHFVPIIGVCHIAYIPKDKILGLSKFNRVVDFFSRRPQVQEKLTNDILTCLMSHLDTPDIAVCIDASHMCVRLRGIKDQRTMTRTTALSGLFKEADSRAEFLAAIKPADF